MSPKKKLLVLVGAGASVHLGIPGVAAVGDLLRRACLQRYPLAVDPNRSIYDWLVDEITAYRRGHLKPGFVQEPNFEDVLYTALQLGSLYPNGHYSASIGAFIGLRHFPDVMLFGKQKQFRQHDWAQLGSYLTDTIIETFREACLALKPAKSGLIAEMGSFFHALEASYELAVVTLNYDDAIWRLLPQLETGFDPASGRFDERRLFERPSWGCLLHLHGSVHLGMGPDALHEIQWQDDLAQPFAQNAAGRSSVYTTEGMVFPQSVIVAGYGKTQQILRRPFRTYYSELDRLVTGSDALLCLGYGFADIHLNGALEAYRDNRDRPVVMIDWANDDAMSAAHAYWEEGRSINTALRTFRTKAGIMDALGTRAPTTVETLKKASAFDRSSDPHTRLSVWYSGTEEACRNAPAVLAELA